MEQAKRNYALNQLKLVLCAVILCLSAHAYATAAPANCTLGAIPFTIETASSQFVATLTGQRATVSNIGSVDVEIGYNGQTIGTAGVQGAGQFTLKAGASFSVNGNWTSFSYKSASASLLIYLLSN